MITYPTCMIIPHTPEWAGFLDSCQTSTSTVSVGEESNVEPYPHPHPHPPSPSPSPPPSPSPSPLPSPILLPDSSSPPPPILPQYQVSFLLSFWAGPLVMSRNVLYTYNGATSIDAGGELNDYEPTCDVSWDSYDGMCICNSNTTTIQNHTRDLRLVDPTTRCLPLVHARHH